MSKFEGLFWACLPLAIISSLGAGLVFFFTSIRNDTPVEQRAQTVHEMQCPEKTFYFYIPENTYGIIFDEKGRKVSRLPDCVSVKYGRSDKAGGKIHAL